MSLFSRLFRHAPASKAHFRHEIYGEKESRVLFALPEVVSNFPHVLWNSGHIQESSIRKGDLEEFRRIMEDPLIARFGLCCARMNFLFLRSVSGMKIIETEREWKVTSSPSPRAGEGQCHRASKKCLPGYWNEDPVRAPASRNQNFIIETSNWKRKFIIESLKPHSETTNWKLKFET